MMFQTTVFFVLLAHTMNKEDKVVYHTIVITIKVRQVSRRSSTENLHTYQSDSSTCSSNSKLRDRKGKEGEKEGVNLECQVNAQIYSLH